MINRHVPATNTPVEQGRRAAAQFKHPIYVIVANAGHTPDLQPCGVRAGRAVAPAQLPLVATGATTRVTGTVAGARVRLRVAAGSQTPMP